MSGSSLSKSQLTTPMQAKLQEQLSPDAEVILPRLPERLQATSIAPTAEIEYPIDTMV